MTVAITSIGTANPELRGRQQDVTEFMAEALQLRPAEKRRLQSLYHATGIEYRHSVLDDFKKSRGEYTFFPNDLDAPFPGTAARMQIYQKTALPLALKAIQDCCEDRPDFDKTNITHLITISCTGMYAPGLDIEIIENLKLSNSIHRTAINFMGCYGAFNGIKTAYSICRADPAAKVLVVSVELCTIHFQKSKLPDDAIASAIFADGAAALLIEANPSSAKYFSLENFYCDLLPQGRKEMAWHIADQGFSMVLSAYVPKVVESGIKDFASRLLSQAQLSFSDIGFFAIHPGGMKILQVCETTLGVTSEDNRYSYQVLREFGNMSSATVIFVLQKIWQDISKNDHNKNLFSCAFGPGLTLESALMRIHHV